MKKLHFRRYGNHRRSTGAVLVEAVVGLSLLVFGMLVGTVFLVDAGAGMLRYLKIVYITQQLTSYATTSSPTLNLQEKVETFATKVVLPIDGIPKKEITVKTERDTTVGQPITVRVQVVDNYQLPISLRDFLCSSIVVQDKELAVVGGGAVAAPGGGGVSPPAGNNNGQSGGPLLVAIPIPGLQGQVYNGANSYVYVPAVGISGQSVQGFLAGGNPGVIQANVPHVFNQVGDVPGENGSVFFNANTIEFTVPTNMGGY